MQSPNVLEVTEMWSRPTYDQRLTDKFRKLTVKFQRAFQVVTKPEAVEYDIFNDDRLPASGSIYSANYPYVYSDGVNTQRVSPIYWIVTYDYNGELASLTDGGTDNPLLAPPRIDWDDVETDEAIDEDWDGNPIQTVNGEPIDGVTVPIPDQTVTIKRNMLIFNSYVQARYRRAVNSDLFLGWPPGTARITKFSASNVTTKEQAYWEITAQIQFRFPYRTTPERAWYSRVRHEGFYERVQLSGPGNAGTRIVRAVDGNKEPVTKPVLLNAQGFRIQTEEPGQPVTAHWLEFKKFDSLPFNALGLI
jgi:hypothetical protein